jgi:MFS family permease
MDAIKDKYFSRNASGVALVEFFWGLGFPVVLESTFLQVFLKKVGASDFLIGLVPAILVAGFSILPLVSSYMTRNIESKRKVVLYLHLVSSCATLGYGILLFFIQGTSWILPAFFIAYVIFSLCLGLTFPVWLHYLVKIFSEHKSIKGLSIMYLAQNTAKIISSLFILKVVEVYALSLDSAAWIFLGSGLLFLIGSLCFVFTKELPYETAPSFIGSSFFSHTKETLLEMIRNKNMVTYLIGDLDNYVIITAISFYAVYATQHYGITDYTAAGLFVAFIYSGSILSNLALGTMGLLSLKQKFISTKLVGMAALAILIFSPNFAGFLTASLLLGFCRGTRSIIYSPCIKKFGNKEETTGFFAAAPLLTIGFGSGFPVLFGKSLDWMARMGSTAYQLMFGLSFVIIMITLVFGLMTDFSDELKNTP